MVSCATVLISLFDPFDALYSEVVSRAMVSVCLIRLLSGKLSHPKVYNQPDLNFTVTLYNIAMSSTSPILISSTSTDDSDATIPYAEGNTESDSVDLIPVPRDNSDHGTADESESEEEEYRIARPYTRYTREQLEKYDDMRASFDSNFARVEDLDEELHIQRLRLRTATIAQEIIATERQQYMIYHLIQARNGFIRSMRADKRAMMQLEEDFFAQRRIAGWEELRVDWTAAGYNTNLRLRGAVCPQAPRPAQPLPRCAAHRQRAAHRVARAARIDRDAHERAADRRAAGPEATP